MTTSTLERRKRRMTSQDAPTVTRAVRHDAALSARRQADEHARQIESAWDQAFFG